jgi:hypothetical protein
MTDSLRENELGVESGAFAKFIEANQYSPDLEAYKVDEANEPYRRLHESITAGARFELRLTCADGRREVINLTHAESIAWERDTLEDRIWFANAKICERRATIAYKAARRLQERGQQPSPKTCTPEEEAYLREFGLVEDALVPKQEGGYDRQLQLRERQIRSVRLREDGFWDGSFNDVAGYGYDAPTQREYLPRGGPQGQQQLISDVWDSQAKCYYAWTHDPVARSACELIADFILGRGVSVTAEDERVQAVLDEFITRERMDLRLHAFTVSLTRDGENLLRYMPLGDGRLKVRSLPPETIWEIVTDSEDPMTVFWYVQRYQTRYVMFAPPGLDAAKTRWIERMLPAEDVLHVKINAKESDVRGRSDLFPALGWMKRLRDYFDALIQKEYAAAAYQWKYIIDGGAADIQRVMASVIPSGRPQPGSYFAANKHVDVEAVASGVKTVSGQGSAYESLLNHIAIAFVLSKSYFGADSHENRASALVATEPTAKHLETRQDVIGWMYEQILDRVIDEAKRFGLLDGVKDFTYKATFPSIIKADAATRAGLIREAEASGYISKQTAAEAFAGEAELDDYDFDTEMEKLKTELGPGQNPLQLIAHDMQMVKKGVPEERDVAFDPGEVPNPGAADARPAQPPSTPGKTPPKPDAGNASPTSAAGAAKIRNERGRGGAEDSTTMESDDHAFREAARKRGAIVIYP